MSAFLFPHLPTRDGVHSPSSVAERQTRAPGHVVARPAPSPLGLAAYLFSLIGAPLRALGGVLSHGRGDAR